MGASADAHVCYGIPFEQEYDDDYELIPRFPGDGDDEIGEDIVMYADLYSWLSQFDDCPFEVHHVGDMMNYTSEILALKDTHQYAYGYNVDVLDVKKIRELSEYMHLKLNAALIWAGEHNLRLPVQGWDWIFWGSYG